MKSIAPRVPPDPPSGLLARLRRSVVSRVVTAAVLATAAAAVVGGGALARVAVHRMLALAVPASVVDDAALDACVAAEGAWSIDRPSLTIRAHALDGTGASGSLDPLLARQLALGLDPAFRLHSRVDAGGALAWTTGRSGPCAVVHVRWYREVATGQRVLLVAAGLSALVTVGFTLFALWVAVRPTVRRVQEIAWAARRIGSEQWRPLEGGADDLGQIAERLSEAHARIRRDRAAAAERRRALERHLSDVAHDLRTPLAALQLRLERIRPSESADADAVDAALADVVYLSQLTANLNLAAQLRDGAPSGRVDLGQVVDRVVARFHLLGERRGVQVVGARPDEQVWVSAHPVHAEQLVGNLVHNAVVHSASNVAVVVDVVGDGFELIVADDGPGVPASQLSSLRRRSVRADRARTREPTGRGLGLSIVAQVCAAQDWTLAFEDNEPGLRVRVGGRTLTE